MTARVPNWPLVLAAKVEEWRARPFEFGNSDCLQFAGDVVLALTGVDYRQQFPVYLSEQAAEQILDAAGGLAGILTKCLGKPKPIAHAMRGDLVLAEFANGPVPAVCLGVMCCAPSERGLLFQPTAIARLAWSV